MKEQTSDGRPAPESNSESTESDGSRRDFLRKTVTASLTGAAAVAAPLSATAGKDAGKADDCGMEFFKQPRLSKKSPKPLIKLSRNIESLINKRTALEPQQVGRLMRVIDHVLPNLDQVSKGRFYIGIYGGLGLQTCTGGHVCDGQDTCPTMCTGEDNPDCDTEACGVQTCTGSHECGTQSCGTNACSPEVHGCGQYNALGLDAMISKYGLEDAWARVQQTLKYPFKPEVRYFK